MSKIERIEMNHVLQVPDLWASFLEAVLHIEKTAETSACPVCETTWATLYKRHLGNATSGCVVLHYKDHRRFTLMCCECLSLDPKKVLARFRELEPDMKVAVPGTSKMH